MSLLKILSILFGAIALLVIPFLGIEGLSPQGHITLAIFCLAALFWMFEPVPIYATSLLVIFLQIMLLSKQGALLSMGAADFEGADFKAFISSLAHPIIILFLFAFFPIFF